MATNSKLLRVKRVCKYVKFRIIKPSNLLTLIHENFSDYLKKTIIDFANED